jgi:exopolysaccharide biosynthesis polyprenyl glycosylphosphotransferase
LVHTAAPVRRNRRAAGLSTKLASTAIAADAGVIAISLWLACEIRSHWGSWGQDLGDSVHLCVTYGPWMGFAWLLWLGLRGCYSAKHFSAGGEEFARVVNACLLAAGSVAMFCYLIKFDLSRGFVCLTFMIGTTLLLSVRYLLRQGLHQLHRRGRLQRRVLVVGDGSSVMEIAHVLGRADHAGYRVVGACYGPEPLGTRGQPYREVPHLGSVGDVQSICAAAEIDAVLVAGGQFAGSEDVRRIAWALEDTEVDLIVAPNLTDIAGPRVHIRPVGGLPLLHVERPSADDSVRWGKRSFDVVGSLGLLIASLPLWAMVAVVIKLHDGGPIFFMQRRVGLRGREFSCLKFRSMVPHAEALVDGLAELNESDGALFKIRRDPRITRVGRTIRRYSVDELPQLINVLRGEMSLVGPRPPLPSEVDRYSGPIDRRLLVRPGLTGLWQVSGRASLSWQDSVRLDLYYVDNWSMTQDVLILAKTIKAVLSGRGAS